MRWLAPSLAALCACYSPARLVECTVSCDTPGASCGDGLTCGANHLCFAHSPCAHPDAPPLDASCPPNAMDLDGDCIPDTLDDCIAPAADATGDFDGDTLQNGPDPCPWDKVMTDDHDGDAIPMPCDPFPNHDGDRKRCTMAFSDPGLTQQVWGKRGGDTVWTTTVNQIAGDGSGGSASLRALQSLEGNNATTYDAVMTLHGGSTARFTLWVRASDQRVNDVGCEFDNGDLFVLGPGATNIGQPTGTAPDPAKVRVQATVVPSAGGNNVRCHVQIESNPAASNFDHFNLSMSPGTVGFTVDQGSAEITGLAIYDRTLPAPTL